MALYVQHMLYKCVTEKVATGTSGLELTFAKAQKIYAHFIAAACSYLLPHSMHSTSFYMPHVLSLGHATMSTVCCLPFPVRSESQRP